ncbi:MAG: enoyl-CoA hydratase [Proteobacteria bacterium]|nr:enoyl-CoA hydratase [Pseudomonadota bacterium]
MAESSSSVLSIEKEDGVAIFTLNRPESLNALSAALCGRLVQAFEEIRDDDSVGAVILTGNGRAFSAGVDLKELGGEVKLPEGVPISRNPMPALQQCRQPIVAAVNGLCVTGGLELALACDVLIASSEARFADTHGRVGIVPQWGITQRLPRAIGPSRARQMSFSGNFIDAATAERWGLVSQVVEPERLLPVCLELARDIASAPRGAVRTIKRIYDESAQDGLERGLERELELSREFMRSVPAETIAGRRKQVQERSRRQSRRD